MDLHLTCTGVNLSYITVNWSHRGSTVLISCQENTGYLHEVSKREGGTQKGDITTFCRKFCLGEAKIECDCNRDFHRFSVSQWYL